jgi:hypothetical protein
VCFLLSDLYFLAPGLCVQKESEMPLAFESLSHGTIAFGFFNIESDMLLLDHYFFFADDFCKNIEKLAKNTVNQRFEDVWPIYHIADSQEIGDLNGAIHGVRFTGFIGEVYRRFPFPKKEEDFKQKADGHRNRPVVEEIIQDYAQPVEIEITVVLDNGVIEIGSYRFTRLSFHELINYVWRGGYPRWKDEIRPDYVESLKKALIQNSEGLFRGFVFIE